MLRERMAARKKRNIEEEIKKRETMESQESTEKKASNSIERYFNNTVWLAGLGVAAVVVAFIFGWTFWRSSK